MGVPFTMGVLSSSILPVRTIFTNTGTGCPGSFEKEDVVNPGRDAHTLLRSCTHLSVNAYADLHRGHAHS